MILRVRALIELTKDYESEKILFQIKCSQEIFDQMFKIYRQKKKSDSSMKKVNNI